MTTEAERDLYYRLVREGVGNGAIVELGAWLGASTASIAAAIRDSGVSAKAHVYDKFQSRPGHERKVQAFYAAQGREPATGPSLDQFKANLGPLLDYVEVHKGQIEDMKWNGEPIAVLICDAPKRVPAVSAVLTTLREPLVPGAIMAWQDFCHFPSYEIPACLYRLREHLEFVEAVVPGTTLAFRVRSQWGAEEVASRALSLGRWTPDEIERAWAFWFEYVPQEKRGLFACGAAMFLCDIGHPMEGAELLYRIWADKRVEIVRKWDYLRSNRPDFVVRYGPLFDLMAKAA